MQVCTALTEIHIRGFVHNDLRLSNIMTSERSGSTYSVDIIDFGSTMRMGCALPPEAITRRLSTGYLPGDTLITDKVDVYSLGRIAARLAACMGNCCPSLMHMAEMCSKNEPQLRPTVADIQHQLQELGSPFYSTST
jgi:serine/threonine protein kinase